MHKYTEELLRLSSRNNLGETEDQLIVDARGLKAGVQEKMQLHTAFNLSETINMAEHVEKFLTKVWKFMSTCPTSSNREAPT